MSRLLVRRCSMSSIEEEDEPSSTSEDLTTIQTDQQKSIGTTRLSDRHQSPSLPDWDSELSESEQEFDDNDDDFFENGEDKAANRALQNFMQTASRTRPVQSNDSNGSYSPLSLHLYDDEDSAELDAIISELRDFKIQFEECSNTLPSTSRSKNLKKIHPMYSSTTTTTATLSSSSNPSGTTGCVSELRTLEDQLEAALASLTLTINDCPTNHLDVQQGQRSSDSSACSSGLGDDIGTDSNQQHVTMNQYLFASKTITSITDDCDSAFSDSGSTEKMVSPHPDETIATVRSIVQVGNITKESTSIVVEQDETILSHSQNPSKLLIRTYNDDGSTKSILVDESMSIRDVLFILVHKNHREPDVDYAIVEVLPDLHMERTFEDHQKVTEAILMWPTVSSNRLLFTKRPEKYSLFRTMSSLVTKDDTLLAYEELLKTPDLDGIIYLKEKSRKSWKKHFCVLRSSGLYFIPKGKSKKDLVCLAKFENVELFFGLGWKKKFKSPSEFCFALKHPLIQKKSSKYIKYMCVETKDEFERWITSIRIAKFGQQLKMNYVLMEKAMNIYRSSGRFAVVCAARSSTPAEQKSVLNSSDLPRNSPTPCSAIRERQVLNRTPISSIPHPNSLYQQNSSLTQLSSPSSTSTNSNPSTDEQMNDENSPIKSASYMDELRQRLERVLNDPTSTSTSSIPPPSSLPSDRHSALSILKSFRLPPPQPSIQLPTPSNPNNNAQSRSNLVSRVPMKPSNIRGPTLIVPPKVKPTTSSISPCLNSTENLRVHHETSTHPTMIGSTPLPRKQFQPAERNLSYRTSQQSYPTNPPTIPSSQQQMSKSFIIPTKREEHRSASSLSVASKTDSMSLDENDMTNFVEDTSKSKTKTLPPPSTSSQRSRLVSPAVPPPSLKKPSMSFRTNSRVQNSLPVKTPAINSSMKLPQSISQTGLINKSLVASNSNNSLNNNPNSHLVKPSHSIAKPVPPVPPRKSSIPRPAMNGTTSLALKPQPPQRDSSNHYQTHSHLIPIAPKAHISHL